MADRSNRNASSDSDSDSVVEVAVPTPPSPLIVTVPSTPDTESNFVQAVVELEALVDSLLPSMNWFNDPRPIPAVDMGSLPLGDNLFNLDEPFQPQPDRVNDDDDDDASITDISTSLFSTESESEFSTDFDDIEVLSTCEADDLVPSLQFADLPALAVPLHAQGPPYLLVHVPTTDDGPVVPIPGTMTVVPLSSPIPPETNYMTLHAGRTPPFLSSPVPSPEPVYPADTLFYFSPCYAPAEPSPQTPDNSPAPAEPTPATSPAPTVNFTPERAVTPLTPLSTPQRAATPEPVPSTSGLQDSLRRVTRRLDFDDAETTARQALTMEIPRLLRTLYFLVDWQQDFVAEVGPNLQAEERRLLTRHVNELDDMAYNLRRLYRLMRLQDEEDRGEDVEE